MGKRLFDFAAAGLALALLSPLFLGIMLVLRLTGEGKVFYGQERRGRFGRSFRILKFATMLENSPNLPGGDITVGNDPRILPIGHFLRDTKINELPQLINIVKGEMSVIGPRPLTLRVAALFPDDYWQRIAGLRPGLSGIGSIVFRDEETLLAKAPDRQAIYSKAIVPYKMALEIWYSENQSLIVDLKLIALTIAAVLRPNLLAEHYLSSLPPAPPEIAALRIQAKSRN